MAEFMIHFLLCSLLLGIVIGMFLSAKRALGNTLTGRMQYRLWYPLFFLLAAPFFPVRLPGFSGIARWLRLPDRLQAAADAGHAADLDPGRAGSADWMNDFALSVNRSTPPLIGAVLFAIWTAGMLAVLLLTVRSLLRLCAIRRASLPVQNQKVRSLYRRCLREAGITRGIPIRSTPYLRSPVIAGLLQPCIYLPLPLISDCRGTDLRYMLLHELMHYKHRDFIAAPLMNLAGIVYWFHPLVWYALGEMRTDREVACDTSVLRMLDPDSYDDYGNTLICFAEKRPPVPFPFAAGLGGGMRQMKRRIQNIASYERPSRRKRAAGLGLCALITCILFAFTPALSSRASAAHVRQTDPGVTAPLPDLSAHFQGREGCFVLLQASTGRWQVYNEALAQRRVPPDSTYKIYSALCALETGIITPASNDMAWDGQEYPIAAWNDNQNLASAFQNSVNWYFQNLDQAAGREALVDFYTTIDYGNHDLSGPLSTFWSESSLEISPIEQVRLLDRLLSGGLPYDADNVAAVKDAMLLSSSDDGSLYGKTGTGVVGGENTRGWLVGCVETSSDTWIFAVYIQGAADAGGSKASEIALSVLAELGIWEAGS